MKKKKARRRSPTVLRSREKTSMSFDVTRDDSFFPTRFSRVRSRPLKDTIRTREALYDIAFSRIPSSIPRRSALLETLSPEREEIAFPEISPERISRPVGSRLRDVPVVLPTVNDHSALRKSVICSERHDRRRALFAMSKIGRRGQGAKSYTKWTDDSYVRCK